jgi:hypothetical protein
MLAELEEIFEQSLAHFKSDPKEETYRALKDAQERLMFYRIAAGRPISDLLPRMQQVLRPKP